MNHEREEARRVWPTGSFWTRPEEWKPILSRLAQTAPPSRCPSQVLPSAASTT